MAVTICLAKTSREVFWLVVFWLSLPVSYTINKNQLQLSSRTNHMSDIKHKTYDWINELHDKIIQNRTLHSLQMQTFKLVQLF